MESCLTILKHVKSSLSKAENRVASYVENKPKDVIALNITELAKEANTSTSAVIRLYKKLGINSYSEFKLTLAKEIFSEKEASGPFLLDLSKGDSIHSITQRISDTVINSIESLKYVLDSNQVTKVVQAILSSKNILLAGIGASSLVANDFYQKLIRLGIQCVCPIDTDLQLVHSCSLGSKDLCIIVSYSGETPAMIALAKSVKENNGLVVAITRVGPNSLSKLSDLIINIPNSESLYRQGATLSRLNQLLVVDILYSALIVNKKDSAAKIKGTWQAILSSRRNN